jgi:hypothetical protein
MRGPVVYDGGSAPKPLGQGQRRPTSAPLAAAALGAGLALGALPHPALATELEVQADTAAQGYQVNSPWGDVTVDRRRFTQTIGLGVYNL